MAGLAYAVALALAAVMGIAGGAKLARRGRTERVFRSLGLAWPAALARAVPLSELVLAIALVSTPGWGGVATLAVVAGFTTYLIRSLRRGDRLGCGCFGAADPAPAGGAELVRNGVLLLAAGFVTVAAEGPVVPSPAALAVVAATGVGTAVALGGLRRRFGDQGALAVGGLAPGRPAPPVPGVDLHAGATTLVAFVSPTCAGCDELRASLGHLQRGDVTVVVVDLADDASSPVAGAYQVRSAPFVVVVDGRGLVRSSGRARSPEDVQDLLDA